MASDAGTTQHGLSALLGAARGSRRAVPELAFYSALRRIECAHRDMPLLGEAASPADEPVRLGQEASLAFRASALASVVDADEDGPARLRVSFFGAWGPHGPLPTHLTEYVHQRQHNHRDATLGRFLDVFHHRLLTLLYRAWANVQPTVNQDRPARDRFARYLGALIGQGSSATARPPSELDRLGLFTAGHFSKVTRHAEGLEKTLRASFGVDVAIEQFVGQWLRIPDAYRWRVPDSQVDRPGIGVLGESTRLGAEVWDWQSKFRVVIGPLGRADYERFLPGGDHLVRLLALVARYAGPELGWDVRLVLREPDRRAAVLGRVGTVGRTSHLGGAEGAGQVFEDLVLDPSDHAVGERG
jgi:type VI secretion system protein ImpH